jgi:hypothetical protein
MCLSSFIHHGHDFILYSYDAIEAPKGVRVRDAGEIIHEEDFFTYHDGLGKGSPSAFSNLFRYQLLLTYGDWWVDTDVVCLSDRLPSQEIVFAYEDTKSINGAVLKVPQSHPLAFELLAEAKALGRQIAWGQAGPYLITRVVKRQGLEHYCVEPETIYPISYEEPLDLFRPSMHEEASQKCENACFLHLWNEMLRRSAVRKDIAPPSGSYIRTLFDRHGVTFQSGLEYTTNEIEFMHLNSHYTRHKLERNMQTLRDSYDELLTKYHILEDLLKEISRAGPESNTLMLDNPSPNPASATSLTSLKKLRERMSSRIRNMLRPS